MKRGPERSYYFRQTFAVFSNPCPTYSPFFAVGFILCQAYGGGEGSRNHAPGGVAKATILSGRAYGLAPLKEYSTPPPRRAPRRSSRGERRVRARVRRGSRP